MKYTHLNKRRSSYLLCFFVCIINYTKSYIRSCSVCKTIREKEKENTFGAFKCFIILLSFICIHFFVFFFSCVCIIAPSALSWAADDDAHLCCDAANIDFIHSSNRTNPWLCVHAKSWSRGGQMCWNDASPLQKQRYIYGTHILRWKYSNRFLLSHIMWLLNSVRIVNVRSFQRQSEVMNHVHHSTHSSEFCLNFIRKSTFLSCRNLLEKKIRCEKSKTCFFYLQTEKKKEMK